MNVNGITATALACSLAVGVTGVANAEDLIVADHANITFPACQTEFNYYYRFTVVDDGGGISSPQVTGLDYMLSSGRWSSTATTRTSSPTRRST